MSIEHRATGASSAVLVCFALPQEAKPFQKSSCAARANILFNGIGKANAEQTFKNALTQHTPSCVLTCGFAGGLNPDLKSGDVVFNSDDPKLKERLLTSGAKAVKFFCVDRIAVAAAEKRRLREATGADAVEMESEIIQAICRERKISCATVRVISDAANEDLPLDFNALSNADQSLNYAKLAWAIAKSPAKIPALMRLGKQTAVAAEHLAAVLAKVIPQI